MDVDQTAEALAGEPEERREDPRLEMDEEAVLLLLNQGSRLPCRLIELSLTGCRMSARERFSAGIHVRVEASFKVRGIAFRFSGVTEWTDGKSLIGVRFVDVTSRRMDELIEVLCEVAAENAAKAMKQAAERRVAEEEARKQAAAKAVAQPRPSLASRSPAPLGGVLETAPKGLAERGAIAQPVPFGPKPLPSNGNASPTAPQPSASNPAAPPAAKPAGRERRTQARHEVDTSAVLFLVNIGSRLSGRIINLSLGGCRIRTDERFPVGIYTRVETEFRLEGLPFRLGGVVQAIQDRFHVGIRFLDMSDRKTAQVEQLIGEIEEMEERQKPAGEQAACGEALPVQAEAPLPIG